MLREKVDEVEPSKIDIYSMGGVKGCPQEYSYLNAHFECDNDFGLECVCDDCWNREYKEVDIK
jgi:hypothetical protein